MRRKQRNVSVSEEEWERMEKFIEEFKDELRMFEVDKPGKLLKVMSRFGEKPLRALLENARKEKG